MDKKYIVVVTGGRNYPYEEAIAVFKKLDQWQDFFNRQNSQMEFLFHGGAKGIDTIAGVWAQDRLGEDAVVEILPEWDVYGKSAGVRRNELMLNNALEKAKENGATVVLLAFKGGVGTADCIKRATKKCIEIWTHDI